MALAAAATAGLSAAWPFAAILAVAFVFGLTASGWNGVFLAEAARLAAGAGGGDHRRPLHDHLRRHGGRPAGLSSLVASGLGYSGGYLMVSAIAFIGTLAMIQRPAAVS